MLQLIDISEIKTRGDRIGCPLTKLAVAANLHPTTAYRAARDPTHDVRRSTQVRLMQALISREREELRRLAALHPDLIEELAGVRPVAPAPLIAAA